MKTIPILKNSKRLFSLFALALISFASQAAGWNIDPLRIDLSPKQKTAAMTITNASNKSTTIQIQPIAWSQVDGKDVYLPTRELLVTPPIVTIPAQSSQIIRMALRIPADKSEELTYRINLQEISPSISENVTAVEVAMRVSVPVFIQPQTGKAEPKLTWKVSSAPDSMIKIELHNEGNAHVKITDFTLLSVGAEHSVVNDTGANYILSGQSHAWILKPSGSETIAGEPLHLKAYTDSVNVDTVIVLDKP
jgi:fimbrial chaperone protein